MWHLELRAPVVRTVVVKHGCLWRNGKTAKPVHPAVPLLPCLCCRASAASLKLLKFAHHILLPLFSAANCSFEPTCHSAIRSTSMQFQRSLWRANIHATCPCSALCLCTQTGPKQDNLIVPCCLPHGMELSAFADGVLSSAADPVLLTWWQPWQHTLLLTRSDLLIFWKHTRTCSCSHLFFLGASVLYLQQLVNVSLIFFNLECKAFTYSLVTLRDLLFLAFTKY